MLLIDEAHRCRPRALSEIRDIADKLHIAVILIGTDRLETVLGRDEHDSGLHQYPNDSAGIDPARMATAASSGGFQRVIATDLWAH
jgi:hypothetical protein